MADITIVRGHTKILPVHLAFSLGENDVVKSQIRSDRNSSSRLIAEWIVNRVETDETNKEVVLVLDNSVTSAIEDETGYMDLVRFSNGEPLSVGNGTVLEVCFVDHITDIS